MIIDFFHSFKDYDEILNFYGIWDYSCPNPECHAQMHPMRRHAKYRRGLVIWDAETDSLMDRQLEILRLKCASCGRTHAVLTMDMIPFFAYSIRAFLSLLSMCLEPGGSVLRAERITGVSYQLLYCFLRIFRDYSRKAALFLRLEALWDKPGQPSDCQMLLLLGAQPPPWPGAAFFRHFRSPLFMHRRNTVSYPLLFGAASF